MTVIALVKNRKGRLMIGADRQMTWGYGYKQHVPFPKICNKAGVLLAGCGSGDLVHLMIRAGGFKVPERRTSCVETYMYHTFKPSVKKFLISQGYAIKNELAIPPDLDSEFIIGIDGTGWILGIGNPDNDTKGSDAFIGSVELMPISLPYASGSGGSYCIGIINYELNRKKYITKEEFIVALKTTAQLDSAVNDTIDILTEDDYE